MEFTFVVKDLPKANRGSLLSLTLTSPTLV